jgi:hypothetical protein
VAATTASGDPTYATDALALSEPSADVVVAFGVTSEQWQALSNELQEELITLADKHQNELAKIGVQLQGFDFLSKGNVGVGSSVSRRERSGERGGLSTLCREYH